MLHFILWERKHHYSVGRASFAQCRKSDLYAYLENPTNSCHLLSRQIHTKVTWNLMLKRSPRLDNHPSFGWLSTKANQIICSHWGNDVWDGIKYVWKRGTAWEGASIIDGVCYLGAWLGVTPGLVGFSGNSWNRHDEKKDGWGWLKWK